MATEFLLNGRPASFAGDPETPLLWVIRDHLGLTGTKYGCGVAQCGACTVHLDGKNRRSCVTPVGMVAGRKVTTIEGASGKVADAVKAAWVQLDVPQCGFCQSGQVMSAIGLLSAKPNPDRHRHRPRHGRQHLPLRDLCADPPGDQGRCEGGPGMNALTPDRRQFLAASGLVIGLALPTRGARAAAPTAPFQPNAFVKVTPDNLVTVVVKHIEMGQGPTTGLTTILADEMDADWGQMRTEFAPANDPLYKNLAFGTMGTGGSTAMANSWMQMRNAGASARAMLVTAAAKRWGVAESAVKVSRAWSAPAATARTFGELAAEAAMVPPPARPVLKTPDQFTLIGTDLPKLDSAIKTDGSAQFTMDVKRPGMVHTAILHAARVRRQGGQGRQRRGAGGARRAGRADDPAGRGRLRQRYLVGDARPQCARGRLGPVRARRRARATQMLADLSQGRGDPGQRGAQGGRCRRRRWRARRRRSRRNTSSRSSPTRRWSRWTP